MVSLKKSDTIIITYYKWHNEVIKITCIVDFETEEELKEAVKNGTDFMIKDPSFINTTSYMASEMIAGQVVVVTNHPKRSWFASIKNIEGVLKVLN